MLVLEEKTENIKMDDPLSLNVYCIGVISAYVGIACIFFHFTWVYGTLFVIASGIVLVLMVRTVESRLGETKRKVEEGGKQITQ